MDIFTPEMRSKIMRGVKSKNTKLELLVRRSLFAAGYRFHIHRRDLPGRPDISFSSRRKAIFVHGCFWHQHPDLSCRISRRPTTNTDFWNAKLLRNQERDQKAIAGLEALGWSVMIVWECEAKDQKSLLERLQDFLGPCRWTTASNSEESL